MAIEFHCEHCNTLVEVPNEVGGRPGKCPHCQGMNYIPLPESQSGEIPLEPVDREFEKHRQAAAAEDFAFQRKLMSDRAAPGDERRPGPRGAGPRPTSAGPLSIKQASSLIVSFITAMAGGSLPKADEIAGKLRPHSKMVNRILDDMLSASNIAAYGLPTLPKPVLNGFVKQLRAKLP